MAAMAFYSMKATASRLTPLFRLIRFLFVRPVTN